MADYKEMYLTMVRATECAINMLIEAQQKCEDIYINAFSDEEDTKQEVNGNNGATRNEH